MMKTKNMCAILGNAADYDGLLPLTEHRPLDMLPFDCKYRLLDFPLSSVANASINHVFMVFSDGETQSIFDHIGGGKEWNLDTLQNRFFIYFYQDFLKKKEAGDLYLKSIIDYLKKSKAEYTVFMGSKMLCNIDLRAVLKSHQTQNNQMTVVYKRVETPNVFATDAILELDDEGNATSYHPYSEHQPDSSRLNLCMDIFILQTQWLIERLEAGQRNNCPVNLQEFLRLLIGQGKTSTYEYTGYLSNIYDIKSYYEANMDMLASGKFNSLMYSSKKNYTKRKNEIPTYYGKDSHVRNSQCATGCKIDGMVDNSLLFRRTVIQKAANVSHSIVMANAVIGENAVVEYAILDKNVVIQAGITIKGTPEHPLVVKKNQVISENIIGGTI